MCTTVTVQLENECIGRRVNLLLRGPALNQLQMATFLGLKDVYAYFKRQY